MGSGLLAASAVRAASESRRKTFKDELANAIRDRTFWSLVNATLGRDVNSAFWDLTLMDRQGQLYKVRLPIANGVDPYALSTCDLLVMRIGAPA
jgi:hypothetical protein